MNKRLIEWALFLSYIALALVLFVASFSISFDSLGRAVPIMILIVLIKQFTLKNEIVKEINGNS